MTAVDLADRLHALAHRRGWRCLRSLPRQHVLTLVRAADPELFWHLTGVAVDTQREALSLLKAAEAASASLRRLLSDMEVDDR
jgi:hypothetical protein